MCGYEESETERSEIHISCEKIVNEPLRNAIMLMITKPEFFPIYQQHKIGILSPNKNAFQ